MQQLSDYQQAHINLSAIYGYINNYLYIKESGENCSPQLLAFNTPVIKWLISNYMKTREGSLRKKT